MTKVIWAGLLLSAVAGWVDAVGFLQLGGLYPSFMSGNTTQLGIAIGTLDWGAVGLPAMLILLFAGGAFSGTLLLDSGSPHAHRLCFAIEALLLVVAMVLAWLHAPAAIAFTPLAIAMGLQNVIAGSMSRTQAGRTFVTGCLVSAGEGLARAVNGKSADWLTPGLAWLAMGLGAIAGATADLALGVMSLAVPALCAAAGAIGSRAIGLGKRPL